jgi:predicted cupin superfamily sugar epimerase
MGASADDWIAVLGLVPHPEGGFYREIHRSSALTSIYYLLPAGGLSPLHRLRTRDEVWHHYAGAPLELHCIRDGVHQLTWLGGELAQGQKPQAVVPASVWQAARASRGFALAGCTVAPPFDFADWEMPSRRQLLAELPSLADLVQELTRQ